MIAWIKRMIKSILDDTGLDAEGYDVFGDYRKDDPGA